VRARVCVCVCVFVRVCVCACVCVCVCALAASPQGWAHNMLVAQKRLLRAQAWRVRHGVPVDRRGKVQGCAAPASCAHVAPFMQAAPRVHAASHPRAGSATRAGGAAAKAAVLESTLDPRVGDFVRCVCARTHCSGCCCCCCCSRRAMPTGEHRGRMIFDKKMMERQMQSQNLDLGKMPLGTLSKAQLDAGYEILRNIQAVRVRHCASLRARASADAHRACALMPAARALSLSASHTHPSSSSGLQVIESDGDGDCVRRSMQVHAARMRAGMHAC
jgi:Poly(ADP-ribose) polymerase, regulatory domain